MDQNDEPTVNSDDPSVIPNDSFVIPSDPSVIPRDIEGSFSNSEIGQTFPGTVTTFDEQIGLGKITLKDGREVDFHCTNIADGTRFIKANTQVSSELYFHPLGRFEAKNIIKLQ